MREYHYHTVRHSFFVKLLFFIFSLIISVILLFFLIITTPLGLNMSIKIADTFLPNIGVFIDNSKIEGDLYTFQLNKITIKTKTNTFIELNKPTISWEPAHLLLNRLTINSLKISSIKIILGDKPNKNENKDKTNIPILIDLQKIKISKLNIITNENKELNFKDININDLYLFENYFKIKNGNIEYKNTPSIAKVNNFSLNLHKPFKINANIKSSLLNQAKILYNNENTHKIYGSLDKSIFIKTRGNAYYKNDFLTYNFLTTIQKDKITNNIHFLKYQDKRLVANLIIDFSKKNLVFSQNILYQTLNDRKYYKYNNEIELQNKITLIKNTKSNTLNINVNDCQISFRKSKKFICDLDFIQDIKTKSNIIDFKFFNPLNTNEFINFKGNIKEPYNLSLKANINDLSDIYFKLNGNLQANLKLQTLNNKLNINGDMLLKNLKYNYLNLGNIYLDVFSNNFQNINIKYEFDKFNIENRYLNLKLQGNLKNFNDFDFYIKKLFIKDFSKNIFNIGFTNIRYKNNEFLFNNFCLVSKINSFCSFVKYNNEKTEFKVKAKVSPFYLKPYFPIIKADNNIFLNIDYEKQVTSRIISSVIASQGDVSLSSQSKFINENFKDLIPVIRIQEFIFTFFKIGIQKYIMLYGSFNENDKIKFHNSIFLDSSFFKYDNIHDFYLDINSSNLEFLKGWISFPVVLNGKFYIYIKGKGNINNIKLDIDSKFSDINVNIIPFNLNIKNSNIKIKSQNLTKFDIDSNIYIKDKKLDIDGSVSLKDLDSFVELNIKGNELNIIDLDALNIKTSPNLQIKFNTMNNLFKLTGNLKIDKSLINIEKINDLQLSSTDLEKDLIFKDEMIKSKNSLINQNIDLNIEISDKVLVKGYGFNSHLFGDILLKQDIFKELLAKGKIYFKNGRFDGFDKTFLIDQDSYISYNNSKISKPDINIIANYLIPAQVKINHSNILNLGISITGIASNPVINFTSNPTMSQSNIISYILIGRPLNSTSNNDGQESSQTAILSQFILLGVLNGGSEFLLNNINNYIDFSSFSFGELQNNSTLTSDLTTVSNNSNVEQNNTALFFTKSITPKLTLSYGYGLFSGLQEINANYILSNKWKLKANYDDIDAGADLIYTINTNDKSIF